MYMTTVRLSFNYFLFSSLHLLPVHFRFLNYLSSNPTPRFIFVLPTWLLELVVTKTTRLWECLGYRDPGETTIHTERELPLLNQQ